MKRELDRQRPSAARRGYSPRWRRARAAYLAHHPLCAACQALGRVVPATVVDHVVPHRGDPVLFWNRANGKAYASAATIASRRAKAAGVDGANDLIPGPGGEGHSLRDRRQGPGGPPPVYAREIQEGGIRPLFGGTAEFRSVEARRFVAFL